MRVEAGVDIHQRLIVQQTSLLKHVSCIPLLPPILTSLEDWPKDLGANTISPQEAEREIKGGARVYLYFIREHGGDSDKDNLINSMGNGQDLMGDSGPEKLDLDVSGILIQCLNPNSTELKMRSPERDLGHVLTPEANDCLTVRREHGGDSDKDNLMNSIGRERDLIGDSSPWNLNSIGSGSLIRGLIVTLRT